MPIRFAEPVVTPNSAQEAAAAERFLSALSRDAAVRARYLEVQHDSEACAAFISEQTGIEVAAENLPTIAGYLIGHHGPQLDELVNEYPAMNEVVITQAEAADLVAPHSAEEAAVADKFIELLATDANVRARYLEADHDVVAVAKVISEATGAHIGPVNLISIQKHLVLNRSKAVGALVNEYPAMNEVIYVRKS